MKIGRGGTRGFTLMEILIATGLFAFAVTGLIALFPMAQRISREGEEEARAALIAGNILDTLAVNAASGSFSLATGTSGGSIRIERIDPFSSGEHSVAYGAACEPLFAMDQNQVEKPAGNPEALDIAMLRLARKSSLPGLVVAEVDVASPAAAPASGRTTNRFVRLFPLPSSHD